MKFFLGLPLFLPVLYSITLPEATGSSFLTTWTGIQSLLSYAIYIFAVSYHSGKKTRLTLGFWIVFGSISACYFLGKSLLFPIFWEISSLGFILLFAREGHPYRSAKSLSILIFISGVSTLLISSWVLLPDKNLGQIALLFALLIKTGFFGLHYWYPEAHKGQVSYASAALSGVLIHIPFYFYWTILLPDTTTLSIEKVLIPLSGIGVFSSALSSFFHRNGRKALAFSTIEVSNFLWMAIFLTHLWKSLEIPELIPLANSFQVLFLVTLLHHSWSKTFQFLAFGVLSRLGDSNHLDRLKGIGRLSQFSTLLMLVGTMSFAGLPGTIGFFSEASVLMVFSHILDLSLAESVFILPAIILILFGFVLGAMSHLRIFLPLLLSVPTPEKVKAYNANPKVFSEGKSIQFVLVLLAVGIFTLPILFPFFLHAYGKDLGILPDFFRTWTFNLALISVGSISIAGFIIYHQNKTRVLTGSHWDCGNQKTGSELSISAHSISEPLYISMGRYFQTKDGNPKIDSLVLNLSEKFLETGKVWIQYVESGEVSSYLFFSATTLIFSVVLVFILEKGQLLPW